MIVQPLRERELSFLRGQLLIKEESKQTLDYFEEKRDWSKEWKIALQTLPIIRIWSPPEEAEQFICHYQPRKFICYYLIKWPTLGVRPQFSDIQNIYEGLIVVEPQIEKEQKQEVFFKIVKEFSKIEKVKSIYTQEYEEELQIYILLSINRYDYDLMSNLLDIEYEIRKKYPEIVFEFFYPPAGTSDKKDFIHPRAQCIYSR